LIYFSIKQRLPGIAILSSQLFIASTPFVSMSPLAHSYLLKDVPYLCVYMEMTSA